MDDLNDLKKAMAAATPRPDPAQRAANLAMAQANFASARRRQPRASSLLARLGAIASAMTSRIGIATTTAFAAAGFFMVTPQGQNLLQPPLPTQITVMEVDQAFAEPRLEQGPLIAEDMPDDMLRQEPLQEPFGEVIQMPLPGPAPEIVLDDAVVPQPESLAESANRAATAEAADEPSDSAGRVTLQSVLGLSPDLSPGFTDGLAQTLREGLWPAPESIDAGMLVLAGTTDNSRANLGHLWLVTAPWDTTMALIVINQAGFQNLEEAQVASAPAVQLVASVSQIAVFEATLSDHQTAPRVTLHFEDGFTLAEQPMAVDQLAEAQYAVAIIGFAKLLRGEIDPAVWGYADAITLAEAAREEDQSEAQEQMLALMRLAQSVAENR